MSTFYEPDKPIYVGLIGKMGSGKTSTASAIVPSAQMTINPGNEPIWEHMFYAMPIYEMIGIKKKIIGIKAHDRRLYELHRVMTTLLPNPLAGAPDYLDMFNLIYELEEWKLPPDGIKPRDFMQKVGDICLGYNKECFVNHLMKESNIRYKNSQLDGPKPYICIVSDVRYQHEAVAIARQNNGLLIELKASDEARAERILQRDGYVPTLAQLNHQSEHLDISRELIDYIIDTDNMTLQGQAQEVKDIITNHFSLKEASHAASE